MINWAALKRHRWIRKAKIVFRQGLTPRELALSIVIGAFIGVMPVFGIAAFIIGLIALVFRLNLPIAIFVTYAITPIHLALFIPFIRLGESILSVQHSFLTLLDVKVAFQADYIVALQQLSFQIICGMVGWFVVGVPIALILFLMIWQFIVFNKKMKQVVKK